MEQRLSLHSVLTMLTEPALVLVLHVTLVVTGVVRLLSVNVTLDIRQPLKTGDKRVKVHTSNNIVTLTFMCTTDLLRHSCTLQCVWYFVLMYCL